MDEGKDIKVRGSVQKGSESGMPDATHEKKTKAIFAVNCVTCIFCLIILIGDIRIGRRLNVLEKASGLNLFPQKLPPPEQPKNSTMQSNAASPVSE